MEEVERLIRDEAQREGSISFARFMERALLEPGLGYYATAQRRLVPRANTERRSFTLNASLHITKFARGSLPSWSL